MNVLNWLCYLNCMYLNTDKYKTHSSNFSCNLSVHAMVIFFLLLQAQRISPIFPKNMHQQHWGIVPDITSCPQACISRHTSWRWVHQMAKSHQLSFPMRKSGNSNLRHPVLLTLSLIINPATFQKVLNLAVLI